MPVNQEGDNEDLFSTVVKGGYCIGCGNCAAASPDVSIEFDASGFLQATRTASGRASPEVAGLCPFSNRSPNESEIADRLSWSDLPSDPSVGRVGEAFSGYVRDEQFRVGGGSGGLTTWLLQELIETGAIDYVHHVKPLPMDGRAERLFGYQMSSSVEELHEGRKSHYYPVELASVYAAIRNTPGRHAIVAIPCFAKAIRLMQQKDPLVSSRATKVIGLVCGHLKSRHFAEYLGWTQGVRPADLLRIDFRRKLEGYPASSYGIGVIGSDRCVSSGRIRDYFGTSWDLGFMKYKACDYCDDVFAETADVVFGDAWLPGLDDDWRGTNVVLVRDREIGAMLRRGASRGEIELEELSVADLAASQLGGLRHRREGLAYRSKMAAEAGIWHPRRRFAAGGESVSRARMTTYALRSWLAAASSKSFRVARKRGYITAFYLNMSPRVFWYYLRTAGLRRAAAETVLAKWVKRKVIRRS